MPSSTDLSALRADLKRKLTDGTYASLSERLSMIPRRIFPGFIKSNLSAFLFWSLLHFLCSNLLYFLDGIEAWKDWAVITLISSFLFWWGVFLYADLYRQLYKVLSEYVVDAMPQPGDILKLDGWIKRASDFKWVLVFFIFFMVFLFGYQFPFLTAIHDSPGIGSIIVSMSAYIPLSIVQHQLLALMLFPLVLSRYEIDLYELDPGISPSLYHLSLVIRNSSNSLSIYATIFTFYLVYLLKMPFFPTGIFYLLPLLGIFVFRQIGLSLIVGRARWTTLERLRTKMEKLDIEHHFDAPAVYGQYKAMLEYYTRVKNAEAGIFDARTGTLLFNSFILPLIAFLLFQFDRIVDFIGRFIH